MDKIKAVIILFSLIGFGDSAFITFFESKAVASCSVNVSIISCENVLTSPYASIFNIPWSLLGMVWFLVFLLLIFTNYDSTYAYLAFAIIGAGSVVYLIYLELIVIKYICIYCTIAHISAIAIIVSSALLIRSFNVTKE